MKTFLLLLSLLVFAISCSKNSTGERDIILPIITITSPTNAQTFTNGQTINITGTITDDNYIAETHIHVTNILTGSLLMDVHLYPAAASATFNQSFTAAAGINYKIQVIAKDRAVNEGRASVEVSCN